MRQQTATFTNRTSAPPLTLVLIGGLALHGGLPTHEITTRAHKMGVSVDASARAILDLIDRGLASVSREGASGHLIATPALDELAQQYRVRSVLAYLGNVKTPARGKDYA